MLPRNAGSPWTQDEEERLYEATGTGTSVADIAAAHGRTHGAITSRQRQMGLRDEAGELISPLPEFRPALREKDGRAAIPPAGRKRLWKGGSSSVLRSASGTWRESQVAALSAAPLAWPEAFPRSGNWLEQLWYALHYDIGELLRDGRQPDAMIERGIAIALARLTPADDFHPAAKLEELGAQYHVTRERIRQLQVKVLRRVAGRVQQEGSLTARVLTEIAEAVPDDHTEAPLSWLATELARQGCHTAFIDFILVAFARRCGTPAKKARRMVEQANPSIRQMRRVEASNQRRDGGVEISEREHKANAFVMRILKKAVWPERLNDRPLDLSGFPALRDCRYEQAYYSETLKRLVSFDSAGERRLIRALDICTIVTQFAEQPLEIHYRLDDRDRTYIPDLLVRTDSDLFFVVEIKGRQQLADRETLAKAEAAQHHLAKRGIGYCLTDANGDGLDDLRALETEDEFRDKLRQLLKRHGTVTRRTFEDTFGRERQRWAYDQLQSAVLREGLHYDTSLVGHPNAPSRYIFDFRLRAE